MTTPWVHYADGAKFPPGVEGVLKEMFPDHAAISRVSYDSSDYNRSIDRVISHIPHLFLADIR